MPTLEEIKEQIRGLDAASALLARKEINELPSILWEGERIHGAVQGVYSSRIGLLVATDRRLIFVDKGFISLKVEDFPYDKITSIQYQTGWVFGEVTIFASGNRAEIKQVTKDQARIFAETVRNMISGGSARPAEAIARVAESEDLIGSLEKLAKLRDQGILTEEEFGAQKRIVLEAMKKQV